MENREKIMMQLQEDPTVDRSTMEVHLFYTCRCPCFFRTTVPYGKEFPEIECFQCNADGL